MVNDQKTVFFLILFVQRGPWMIVSLLASSLMFDFIYIKFSAGAK